MARKNKAAAGKQRQHKQRRAIYAAMKRDNRLQIEAMGEVEIVAGAKGDDGEASLPQFSMVAYTGGKMRPGGWWREEPLIMDVAGMQSPESGVIPVHRDHKTSQVVGHTTEIVAKNQVKLRGLVSATNEHATEVVGSSRNKFPWQSSIGANLLAAPEFVPEGSTVFVNGRRHAGPVYVARKWRLFEASFVSLGADTRTSAVAASEDNTVNEEFKKWLIAKGFDPESLSDVMLAPLQAAFAAENATDDEDDDDQATGKPKKVKAKRQDSRSSDGDADDEDDQASALQARRAAIAAEMQREAKITARLGRFPELAAKAILEGWSEDKIELEHLRATAGRAPAIHSAGQIVDTPNAIEAAMYIAAGIGNEDQAVKLYGEKTVGVARHKCPRAPGLKYLIHEVLRASGDYSHAPGSFDDGTIRAAFIADRMLTASSGFSTISLSGVLSNLANKRLLASFLEVPSVFRRFCSTTGHSDFKQHTKYRVTTNGRLDKVGPTGEIKHTDLDEETYSNQVETFARMIALTRQMMRNDDLDAFLRLPAGLGRISAETLEWSVFETLTNNTDQFFWPLASGVYQPNAYTGGPSALSPESLGLAERLFWKQLNSDGKPINLVPAILLCSPENYRDAVNICNKTTVTVAGDPATGEQLRVGNEYQGEFEPVKSPYVSHGVTGASSTQWWLFARPSLDVAVMEVAFLDNRQAPIIESAETDFNTLGMQWRSYFDWGVAKQERRAGVLMTGA